MWLQFAVLLVATASPDPHEPRLVEAVREAIQDEIDHGLSATRNKDIEQYMEQVPDDYRQIAPDGSVIDKAALRAMQLQAWSIIARTNRLEMRITSIELGCAGECATVLTEQLWDRQMLGRDGTSEHNVVTTQRHRELWELAGSRWINRKLEELGGTITVDGEAYE